MENPQKQVQRWKLVALVSLAFGGGVLVQQYSNASAQRTAATVVRLDTSNCTFGIATGSTPRQVPDGALLMQAVQQGEQRG